MFVDSTGTPAAGSTVVGAISDAARATGADFRYLLATAQVESGLNPRASVGSSSAKGLFQFIDQTWLATLKDAGPSLGYGRYADAITRSSAGRYEVADPAMRRAIFALRNDPAANAAMAGVFTQRNAARLTEKLGRAPSEGDLYVAHFMGASGAARLISLAASNPSASAASYFPNAARANPSIFYDRGGNPRSVAGVYAALVGRYDVARATPAVPSGAVAAAAPAAAPTPTVGPPLVLSPPPIAPVVTSQVASMDPAATPTAMETRPAFQSLFRGDAQRPPVSRFIQDLWTARPQVAAALTGQQSPPTLADAPAPAGTPLDLFSDQPSDARSLFGMRS